MQTSPKTTKALCRIAKTPFFSHATSSRLLIRSFVTFPACRRVQFRALVERRTQTIAKYELVNFPYSYSSLASSTKAEIETELASGSFSDPSRPDLFYHLLSPPTPASSVLPVYALSFLHTPPPSAESSTIIGWLPAGTNNGEQEAGLNDFQENPKFRQLLHEVIQSGLKADIDDIQRNGATQLQQGWMHIHDERNIPALGRIGDPDDILASVLVENGKIKPDTYQPMPAYRLCTSDGLTQLTEGISRHLRKALEERVEIEKSE